MQSAPARRDISRKRSSGCLCLASNICRKGVRLELIACRNQNCATCRADLCPDCVAKQPGGPRGTQLPVCCACGRKVEPITVHRRAVQTFSSRLPRAFAFPLCAAGIIALLFVGLVRAFSSYVGIASFLMGGALFVVRQGLYWAFVFFIIRGVASGARQMGIFDFTDLYSDLVVPAFKGIVSTAILWIPAVVYVYATSEHGLGGFFLLSTYKDPVVWLMAVLGPLYVPMALLAAATDLGFGHILNPIFICHCIYRIGRDYFVATLLAGVVLLVGEGFSALVGASLDRLPLPFIGRWITCTVQLYPPFVAAGMLGVLLYVHGEVLDWGASAEYQELVLPGTEPRGQLRPRPEEKPASPPRPAPAAIPLPVFAAESPPAIVPVALGPDLVVPSLSSVLDLPMAPPLESQAPGPAGEEKLPSILRFGIVLSPGLLEAQAFAAQAEPAPLDLPPAPPQPKTPPAPVQRVPAAPVVAAPPAGPAAPPSATYPGSPAGAVTAFVEPRPGPLNLSAAPTVHGFSPVLPLAAEAAPTRVGHQAAQPPAPPPADKKG